MRKIKIDFWIKIFLSNKEIEETLKIAQTNLSDHKIRFHKINCKKDKNRYSISIPNTQYKILVTIKENNRLLSKLKNLGKISRLLSKLIFLPQLYGQNLSTHK